MSATEERLVDLESKLSHQELALEDLQRAYYEQQKDISRLEAALKRLVAQLENAAASDVERPAANEKPPHY